MPERNTYFVVYNETGEGECCSPDNKKAYVRAKSIRDVITFLDDNLILDNILYISKEDGDVVVYEA